MTLKFIRKLLGCKEDELQLEIEQKDKALNELQTQLEALRDAKKLLKIPKITGSITYIDLKTLLYKLTDKLYISDNKFSTTTLDEAKKFSYESMVHTQKWLADQYDCDNFSYALQGYWSESLYSFPFGIVWSGNHAFNIFIDDAKNIWIVEPQSNKYMTLEEARKASTPDGLSYFPIRLIMI